MSHWPALLAALALSQPAFAQISDEYPYPPTDCQQVNGPVYMCDHSRDWETLDLPEDLAGLGFQFNFGTQAALTVAHSAYVGIQVRAQKYSSAEIDGLIAEELTKIDGYPAITYIYRDARGGREVIVASTNLLLYKTSITAETTQQSDVYTPEHRSQHDLMLAGIHYYWDQ